MLSIYHYSTTLVLVTLVFPVSVEYPYRIQFGECLTVYRGSYAIYLSLQYTTSTCNLSISSILRIPYRIQFGYSLTVYKWSLSTYWIQILFSFMQNREKRTLLSDTHFFLSLTHTHTCTHSINTIIHSYTLYLFPSR